MAPSSEGAGTGAGEFEIDGLINCVPPICLTNATNPISRTTRAREPRQHSTSHPIATTHQIHNTILGVTDWFSGEDTSSPSSWAQRNGTAATTDDLICHEAVPHAVTSELKLVS